MNNQRRKQLAVAHRLIEIGQGIVRGVVDEENGAFGNLPGPIQSSERGSDMELVIGELEDVHMGLEAALSSISDAVELPGNLKTDDVIAALAGKV